MPIKRLETLGLVRSVQSILPESGRGKTQKTAKTGLFPIDQVVVEGEKPAAGVVSFSGPSQGDISSPWLKDESLWTDPGVNRTKYDACTTVDLKDGLCRVDWDDGGSQIFGFTYQGVPIIHGRNKFYDGWRYDSFKQVRQVHFDATQFIVDSGNPELLTHHDLPGKKREAKFMIMGSNVKVSYSSFPPGPQGGQYHALELPDHRNFIILSDSKLYPTVLDAITRPLLIDPVETYAYLNYGRIIVLNECGQIRGRSDSDITAIEGFHYPQLSDAMVLLRDVLLDSSFMRVIRHEAGHYHVNPLVETLSGSDGKPLFGSGRLVKTGEGRIDFSQSDFVSNYAATVPQEDGAETHEFALRLREGYHEQNPEIDLFTLPPRDLDAILRNRMPMVSEAKKLLGSIFGSSRIELSSKLQEKVKAVIMHYQEIKEQKIKEQKIVEDMKWQIFANQNRAFLERKILSS